MAPLLEITFHGMSSVMWIEAYIEAWVARLERSCGPILRCSVLFDGPIPRRREGDTIHIRVNLVVPGRQLAITRDPECEGDEDIYAAVSDVFRSARRQLQDHALTWEQELRDARPVPSSLARFVKLQRA